MALIKCAKCGSDISDKSTNCVICGFKVADTKKKLAKEAELKKLESEHKPEPKKKTSSVVLSSAKTKDDAKEVKDGPKVTQISEENIKKLEEEEKGPKKEEQTSTLNKILAAIIIILLLLLLGGCGYYLKLNNDGLKPATTTKASDSSSDKTAARDVKKQQIMIEADETFLYKDTDYDSEKVEVLKKDEIYDIVAKTESKGTTWYKISLPDGKSGFIPKDNNGKANAKELPYETTKGTTKSVPSSNTTKSTTTTKSTSTTSKTTKSTTTTKPPFTVSFNTDGGSTVKAITVKCGSKLTLPKAPTKTGYNFVKWTDSTGKEVKNGAVLACVNITLKANWQKKPDVYTYKAKLDKFTGQYTITIYRNSETTAASFPSSATICSGAACSSSNSTKISVADPGVTSFIVAPRNKEIIDGKPTLYLKYKEGSNEINTTMTYKK